MLTDFLTIAAFIPIAHNPRQLFGSRSLRRGLVIASHVSGVTYIGTRGGNYQDSIFARIPPGNTLVLTIKDYGPLITGEIWVSCTMINATINGSEIYEIARGRM